MADLNNNLAEKNKTPPRKHHLKSDMIVLGIDGAARDLTECAAKLQQSLGLNLLLHRQQKRGACAGSCP